MSTACNCACHILDTCNHLPQINPMSQSHPNDRINARLQAQGHTAEVAEALLSLDADHFHFVRRVMKGDVPQSLMDELNAGLEATQFHALSAILRIRGG